MIQILTHRGLEPEKKNFFPESTLQAFTNQAKRGFGLEFDVNFTKDGKIVIFHDSSLERISKGKDKRFIAEMTSGEIKKVNLNGSRICDVDEIMSLIEGNKTSINALHLRGDFQEKSYLDILISYLAKRKEVKDKMIIFDVKVKTAKYLRERAPELILAPSVAHKYDIERYNSYVKKTLISIEDAIVNKKLFEWVWLDEWDRSDRNGKEKTLYNEEVFSLLRNGGFKIGLVTPELHGTSPGLLGSEVHQDTKNEEILRARLEKIIKLQPDVICTDYPQLVKNIIKEYI